MFCIVGTSVYYQIVLNITNVGMLFSGQHINSDSEGSAETNKEFSGK